MWTGEPVALFHRFERIAFGCDLQHDHVLHPAVRMGLDGVYSDHVDLMMAVHEATSRLTCGNAISCSTSGAQSHSPLSIPPSTVATMSMTSAPMLSWLRSSDR